MRACIAGTSQGLGLVLSRLMAEKGHTVYAGYRNKASAELQEAAEKYPGLNLLDLDVTSETAAAKAAKSIAEEGGNLDAVIVVAGILPDSDRELLITDAVIEDLRSTLEVNVIGSAIMIKYFSSLVRDKGTFMLISSEAGSMTNIGVNYPGYSISKAAQNKLSAIFAKTISRYKVYALHPGRMNTVMGRGNAQIEAEESALGIYQIISGEKVISPEKGWFIDYRGESMEI